MLSLPLRWALLLTLGLLLAACGDDHIPEVEVPSWAKVAPEQVAEAKKHGVPVAFENDLGMRFVLIPAGTFLMGSPHHEMGRDADEVQQTVRCSRPYYMQVAEVTNALFRRWKPDHDSDLSPWRYSLCGDEQPVHARWWDVVRFTRWIGAQDPSRTYRLPTEAEWEYACRAGTRTPYYWGASFDDAHLYENSNTVVQEWTEDYTSVLSDPDGHVTTAPVGSYLPNPWGLHDMLGNMDEWCGDWYAELPWSWTDVARAQVDPAGPAATDKRVVRSSFCLAQSSYARCAGRYGLSLTRRRAVAGLRLVSPLPDPGER